MNLTFASPQTSSNPCSLNSKHLTEAGPADLWEKSRGGDVWERCRWGRRCGRSEIFNLTKLFGGLQRFSLCLKEETKCYCHLFLVALLRWPLFVNRWQHLKKQKSRFCYFSVLSSWLDSPCRAKTRRRLSRNFLSFCSRRFLRSTPWCALEEHIWGQHSTWESRRRGRSSWVQPSHLSSTSLACSPAPS